MDNMDGIGPDDTDEGGEGRTTFALGFGGPEVAIPA